MTKQFGSKEATTAAGNAPLSMQALALLGAVAVGGLVWIGIADAKSPPIDAAAGEAEALEAASEPEASAPRPLAQGDDEAIARVVREAERTEDGGQELYKRGLYPEALMIWEEAAEAGDAGAAYKIGAAYMDGQSVSHSFDEGLKWLRRSAEMGDGRAMGDLGSAYDWGFGVTQDRAEAAKWFEQGALRGHAASQYNVGVLYEEGEGVEKDVTKAYMYYILANENGFPKYPAEAIEALTPKLTNDQIKKGVDAARAFEPI
ncbi:MAG: tetratricopeptide repeat protein [Candidatus Phaeomarinobacter sp.]